jgi:hypothetical protein
MYCVACGSLLPNGAQFCPRCGKRSDLDGGAPDAVPSGEPSQSSLVADENNNTLVPRPDGRSEDRPALETSTIADGTAPATSPESGEPGQFVGESVEPESATPEASAAPVTTDAKSPARYANAGSITLGAVALICLVLGAVQGFIPIFLIEGAAFGCLAWLCAAKWPLSQSLHSVVLVSSLLLAGLVGVILDQDTFGPRYRYLSQGSAELRVDEKAGRTDRLGSRGWYPVAYDSEAKEINALDAIWTVTLTKGYWEPALAGGNICFTVSNTSGDILDRITIQVQAQKKSNPDASKDSAAALDQQVVLKSYGGGLIGTGDTTLVCASSPRDLTADETWSYTDIHAYGWKR